MKFDDKTLDVLKNFSSINPSIKFDTGNVLRTVSPIKTILARATIGTEVENNFSVGDLSRFMSALSLFNDPEVVLHDKSCTITDGKNKLEYIYTDEEMFKTPPPNDPKLPTVDVQFTLSNENFLAVKKAMSILSLAEMAIVGKDGELRVQAYDSKGVTKDNYSISMGETDKNFIVVFKSENLKLMPYDYEVSISAKGISWFKNPDVEYWIAIEQAYSKFDG